MGHSIEVDYVVEREADHWTVNFQGQHCGRFGSCRVALHSAVGDAERVRRLGHRVRVLVRRSDGKLRMVSPHARPPGDGGPHVQGSRSPPGARPAGHA